MTRPDQLTLLRDTCSLLSQAEVARLLGVSDSAICQVLKGSYAGATDNILQRVEEIFGATVVACPVLGDIALRKCSDNRKKPLHATSPHSVALWRACKKCENPNRRKP